MRHIYISTACHHDLHEQCRLACPYCGAPCVCDHHYSEGLTVTEPLDNPAAPDANGVEETQPAEPQPDATGDDERLTPEDGNAPPDDATPEAPQGAEDVADDDADDDETDA